MTHRPTDPFAGLRVPEPPAELATSLFGPARAPLAVPEARPVVDRLFASRRLWMGWAAACLLLVAADLLVRHAPHPRLGPAAVRLAEREADTEPDAPRGGALVARNGLDAADRQLLDELDLPCSPLLRTCT